MSAAKTVLVADDDPSLLALMARRLSRLGYPVITARDGQEALDLAQQHVPALAVLDVMMPKLTGVEVVAKLRADVTTRDIPIILVSASHSHLLDSETLTVCLTKPFRSDELQRHVLALLAGASHH